jgi:repressor LexA
MDNLTKRQKGVYEFIRSKIRERGYGPTVREIGDHFDIASPNGVMCHLKALEKKGYIQREEGLSRAIRMMKEPAEERGLPLGGRIAAGVFHEAVEAEPLERVDFADMFGKKNMFALQVHGDSMVDAHINDGDYVVIKRQKNASEGDMVIAQTEDGEATLKYWFPERNRIRLQPANASMQPIFAKDAKVLGVVVGVVRKIGKG